MPRYRYKCDACNKVHMIFHLMNEKITICNHCNEPKMKKLLTVPKIILNTDEEIESEVGELTNEYIEANREILEQQKQTAKEDTYEPS